MVVAVIGLAGGLVAPSLATARPSVNPTGTLTVNTNVNDAALEPWQGSTGFGTLQGTPTSKSIDLAPGSYVIYATGHSSASGWYSGPGGADTASTQEAATSVAVTANTTTTIDWTLPPPADLHGKLVDSHGKPVYFACVTTIDTSNGHTSYGTGTGHDGSWDIKTALPGTYDVDFASCPGVSYTGAPWGYPVTFFDGKKGTLSQKKAVAVTIKTNKAGVANSTVAAFGGLHGSVKLPSGATVRVEVYRPNAVKSVGELVLTATPYTAGSIVPGKYQVAFYCQGGTTCGDGVYAWYGGGGEQSSAKLITVTPGKSAHIDEGAIPTVAAKITGHLRQGKVERAGVACDFVRASSCKGSVALTTTLPPAHRHGKPRHHTVTKPFSSPEHSGVPLSFPLPKAVRARLAHHHGVKATLTMTVKGQVTSTEHFTIH